MALQITVKDINGSPIQGVEVKYSALFGLNEIETKITNLSGIVTLTTFDKWLSEYVLDFKKSGYVSYRYSYAEHKQLPTGNLDIALSPAILYFKLYKYNEDTKIEELYKQTIKVEPYRYSNGRMTAETAISSLSRDSDGYYYIDLREHSVSHLIEYTSSYLFKITANSLTNYGSIFLLPDGFIKKEITDWDTFFFGIKINGNTLPDQTMVFYPNTKRLTKAELRKCVVSNPHLMKDAKDDTYCPTNITYSTIYNMIKDSNNRDNNYISGVEDINFYQNKVLTVANSASNACEIKYYINAPGRIRRSASIATGASYTYNIYYSANAQIKAVSKDNNYVVSPSLQNTIMDGNKTITFTCKERTFTYIIEKIELILNTAAGVPTEWAIAKIIGSWKNNEAPNTLDNLEVAVTICDPEVNGYLSFKDTLPNCNNGTYEIVQKRKCNSIDNYDTTDKGIVQTNGNSFYVVSVFFSKTNIYYQFKNNGYYSGGVFHPYVYPEPTNTPSNPGGGSSWGGGQYTVHVNPNGKSVECDLEDNRGNKKHETITQGKTYNVERLSVSGDGFWKYSSTESGAIGSPDANTFFIPNQQDPDGKHIELELIQLW